MVRALEEQYDAFTRGRAGNNLLGPQTGPLPTADELGAELERFLAEQPRPGDNPGADGGRGMRQAGGMRLATWNVNSVKARLPRLLDWLADTEPGRRLPAGDSSAPDGAVPDRARWASWATPRPATATAGGTASRSCPGSGSTTSRVGFAGEPGFPDPEARAISATCGGVRVWSVYVPNGRTPDDPHYAYKLAWLAALRDALAADLAGAPPLAVCGDFNVAPTDADVWDPAVFVGSTHVTPPERAALAALRDPGLRDVVPDADEGPAPFTYWDYRAGMFHQNKGMRIDLVYATPRSPTGSRRRTSTGRPARARALGPRPDRGRRRLAEPLQHVLDEPSDVGASLSAAMTTGSPGRRASHHRAPSTLEHSVPSSAYRRARQALSAA